MEWDERLRRLCLQGPFSCWEFGNEAWFLAGILSLPGGSAVLNSTQVRSSIFPQIHPSWSSALIQLLATLHGHRGSGDALEQVSSCWTS